MTSKQSFSYPNCAASGSQPGAVKIVTRPRWPLVDQPRSAKLAPILNVPGESARLRCRTPTFVQVNLRNLPYNSLTLGRFQARLDYGVAAVNLFEKLRRLRT